MAGYLDIAAADEASTLAAWTAEWNAARAVVPQCALPESQSGPWWIEKYEITPRESERLLRKDIKNNGGRRKLWTPAGIYTRLATNGARNYAYCGEMMYDTMEELALIRDFLSVASGSILVSGLGLGILPTAALLRSDIASITILEIEPDVIALSGKFDDPRINIIPADCWAWQPPNGATFDWVWHDPWGQPPSAQSVAKLAGNYAKVSARQRFYGLDADLTAAVAGFA